MLKLTTVENQTAFEPGDDVDVVAEWQLEDVPERAEVRLVWFTRGKGDPETRIVQVQPLESPKQSDVRGCTLKLPTAPYSFSGKLISLTWAVELVLSDDQTQRVDIVMAPNGKEVVLESVESSSKHWLQFGS